MTDKLDSLRDAELSARHTVEEARREAQKIRLGIGPRIEELEARKERNLARSREASEQKVREAVKRKETEFEEQVSVRMSELDQKRAVLGARAAEILREVIMTDGGEG